MFPRPTTLLCLRLEVTTLEDGTKRKRKRPSRSIRIRKRLASLQDQLTHKTQLISSLTEANQASAYAASLQASLSKQALEPYIPPTVLQPTLSEADCQDSCSLEFSSQENVPAPVTAEQVRYKKVWSDEESLHSDISLTGLPTTISFVGAAARLAQAQRKPSPPLPLAERIQTTPIPSPKPFSPPREYQDYDNWSYIGTPDYVPLQSKEVPASIPKEHNHYKDTRRRRGRRH